MKNLSSIEVYRAGIIADGLRESAVVHHYAASHPDPSDIFINDVHKKFCEIAEILGYKIERSQ